MIDENLRGAAALNTPDPSTAGARWNLESDIPDDIYFRAQEAID